MADQKDIQNSSISEHSGMASPWDRLGAFVIDLVFLFPIVQVLQAPFKRELQTASLIGDTRSLVFMQSFILATFILTFVVYQTLTHVVFHQTLGKKVLGLKVISLSGTLGVYQALLRSFVIIGEFCLLTIPFFAIFSHYRRRPLHDRIADTRVISLKNSWDAPGRQEKKRALLSAGVFAMTVFLFSLLTQPGAPVNEAQLASESFDGDEECEIFQEASDGTMSQAIEAFAVQNIKGSCLRDMSKKALWSGKGDPLLANLGVAFAEAEKDSGKSQDYKKEVCRLDEGSTACAFVRWTDRKPLERRPYFGDILEILKKRDAEDFYRIFFVTALQSHKRYDQAIEVIRTFKNPDNLPQRLAEVTFESLMWQGKWEAGYWVFKLHQLSGEQFSRFVEKANASKEFSKVSLKNLIENFYPNMNVTGDSRGLASEDHAPARMKMLWIRLSGEK